MKFTNYIQEQEVKEKMAMLLFVMENQNEQMNEELQESFGSFMKKLGLPEKTDKGLIDYFVGFTSVAGKMLLAAIKGDKQKIIELSSKITRKGFVDFLVKLDKVTLGIVSAPLEMINVITGWDVEGTIVNLAAGTVNIVKNIHTSIMDLKKDISSIFDSGKAKRLNDKLKYISRNVPKNIHLKK